MNRRGSVLALALLLCIAAGASLAEAQVITATIRGRVVDEQGAVLPGATVTAKQLDTNTVKTATTGGLGQYLVPSLPAGRYELTISLQGFATVTRSVVLTVGMDVTLEFALK